MGAPRVVVWSRAGCHLCTEAIAVVEAVCRELSEALEVRSVDGDPQALAAYAELIPVVLVDDAVIAQWRVTPDQLRAALSD
ncbi:MAG: glutaredoxin family protein [Actinobacteria bacterium]|nr:glutaredoxin family protein [Actinomycetota bacterium]